MREGGVIICPFPADFTVLRDVTFLYHYHYPLSFIIMHSAQGAFVHSAFQLPPLCLRLARLRLAGFGPASLAWPRPGLPLA
jgi:hypothetical protein